MNNVVTRFRSGGRNLTSVLAAGALLAGTPALGAAACRLGTAAGDIQHVIYVQFDNTHFRRDNPNVPSDLEQMPHLLQFMRQNGTLLTNDHTGLISHTGTGILSSLTGVYGDRMGQPVSNSFRYFNPNGTTNPGVSFAYWTDALFDPSNPRAQTDTTPEMINELGKIAPAPWVPYTRNGCDVGMVGTANAVLENIGPDVPKVFGAGSPEAAEVAANPARATADFVGIGVHCAQGSGLCSAANNGRPDLLPDEPGGYTGFAGLFGHKYVAPRISPSGPLTDLSGAMIGDFAGNVGFPGFDGLSAAVSLAYVAAMQEHGIPVTFAYISDAHDNHTTAGAAAFGPGEAGYTAALKAYDDAFARFFDRLAAAGIDKSNTLFVFTVDEGDHFVGSAPSPANCNGGSRPCTYALKGEISGNLAGLLATQQGITTPFTVHSDSAPTIYITGNPARDAGVTRAFGRALGRLTANNPITGKTDQLTVALADAVSMKLLHMVTADPMRTPTLTLFADPNYFLFAGPPNCSAPCLTVPAPGTVPLFAWNHGDVTAEIAQTWVGFVGPGVRNQGIEPKLWSDHTDVRPTMLTVLGLRDDYVHDGRVLAEILETPAVPRGLLEHRSTLLKLAAIYKQINAPFGQLGMTALAVSTTAIKSGTPSDDTTYARLSGQIQSWTSQRDALVAEIKAVLDGAAFGDQVIDEPHAKDLISAAQSLLDQAALVAMP